MSFPPTPPRRVHALKPGCGFTIPPLDGSLCVPEVFDFHYEHNPDHPVFSYAELKTGRLVDIPYGEFVPAAHRAARRIAESTKIDIYAIEPESAPVIAILADSGNLIFTVWCTIKLNYNCRCDYICNDSHRYAPRRHSAIPHLPALLRCCSEHAVGEGQASTYHGER